MPRGIPLYFCSGPGCSVPARRRGFGAGKLGFGKEIAPGGAKI
ncbi:MAG: hypothetical protein ACOYEK_02085 [bacterium]